MVDQNQLIKDGIKKDQIVLIQDCLGNLFGFEGKFAQGIWWQHRLEVATMSGTSGHCNQAMATTRAGSASASRALADVPASATSAHGWSGCAMDVGTRAEPSPPKRASSRGS